MKRILIIILLLIIIKYKVEVKTEKIDDNYIIKIFDYDNSILVNKDGKDLIKDSNHTIMHYRSNENYLILHIYNKTTDNIYYYVVDIKQDMVSDRIDNLSEYLKENNVEESGKLTSWFDIDGCEI